MEKIRFGIIGIGLMGSLFARLINDLPECELVGVADIDEEKLNDIAAKYQIKGYIDYRHLLDRNDVDAVVIAVSEQFHLNPTLDALASGKHIFIEKPLAYNTIEAKKIMNKSDQCSKNILMVGHVLRFDPRYIYAYKAVSEGIIGEVIHVYARRNISTSQAKTVGKRSTPIFYTGVHDIDVINWITGEKITGVWAQGTKKILANAGVLVDDIVFANLQFANGAIGVMEISFVLPQVLGSRKSPCLEVVGTKGMVFVDPYEQGITILGQDFVKNPETFYMFDPLIHGKFSGVYRDELVYFMDCIKTKKKPLIGSAEGYNAVAVAEAIEKSINSGKVEKVQY